MPEGALSVFIVDDSVSVREELKSIISKLQNVKVAGEAGDVEGATQGILQSEPDVIILDMKLGGGSGIEVLLKIRDELPASMIIVLTNFPTSQHRIRCMALGVNHFLDKYSELWKVASLLQNEALR